MKIKRNIGNLLLCLLELGIGALLLLNPIGFTRGIIVSVGAISALYGIVNVFTYFRLDPVIAAMQQRLAKGVCGVLFGVFCIFHFEWFIVTFPILSIVYGIGMLISGACKVQWAVDLLRQKRKYWFIAGIGALLSFVLGIIVLKNPFTTTAILWNFTALSLMAEAVIDIFAILFERKGSGEESE